MLTNEPSKMGDLGALWSKPGSLPDDRQMTILITAPRQLTWQPNHFLSRLCLPRPRLVLCDRDQPSEAHALHWRPRQGHT